MYIPRPAKLLFQHDDGWERFLDKNGHQLSDWTKLSVERMLACGTCAMGVRRYCCSSPDCTHSRFLCQSCKSKACSSCGLKGTEQWIAGQQHILPDCDWQHITFTMPHLLWPFFNNNWPLLNDLFRCATRAMLRHARKLGIEVGIFCALHTYGRQLNQHPHIHVSITRGGLDVRHGVWRDLFFKKQQVEVIWRGAVIRLLRDSYDRVNPGKLPNLGHIRDEKQWKRYLQAQYQRHWKVHFAKKTRGAGRSVKYLGRYLKRPPVAASQLRHYRGGSVVHQYYDHNTQQHKRQKLSQEEMLWRYISHIPSRHFKMVRYYGFLANRKRGTLLPKVYEALEMTPREKPQKPGFAVLMKAFLGTDPYQCILCKGRLRFAGAVAGDHATKMLSDRLYQMAKKRWLRMPELDRCA
ncbi:IS91 family transposase [Erwinia tracheiphila]|uniref:Transposase n=1 Tax=Erwinia tracheiphila TaxID=65700 RepID=A0A0M2KG27_9GAMM|nr:IS91 family transposase [Erwinia tracheiphila]KKF35901.1 transposase [Erwinia tracheiphila]UIA95582.1 IS91 family transposase [Erwinia tracheiphila]